MNSLLMLQIIHEVYVHKHKITNDNLVQLSCNLLFCKEFVMMLLTT